MASSSSEGYGEKDTIIDEMQAKIGDLLKVNQELMQVKHQMDALKQSQFREQQQFAGEKQAFQQQIRSLKSGNADLEAKIMSLKSAKADLEIDRDNLKTTVHELKSTITNLRAEISDIQKSSQAELRQVVSTHREEQTYQADDRDRKIAALTVKINELKEAEERNSNVILRQANDYEKANRERAQLVIDNSQLQNTIVACQAENERLKEAFATEKRKRKSREEVVRTVSEEKEAVEKQLHEKENDNEALCGRVSDLLANIDELKVQLSEVEQESATWQRKYLKLGKRYENLANEMQSREEQIEVAVQELSEIQAKEIEFQQQWANSQAENVTLVQKIAFLERKLSAGKIVARLTQHLMHKLAGIEAASGTGTDPTFRSIVVAAITIRRWRNLVGTPKEYADDQRFWWWLPHASEQGIIAKFQTDQATIEELQKSSEFYHDQSTNLEQAKAALEEEIRENKRQIELYETQIETLTDQCHANEALLETMVEKTELLSVAAKYQHAKTILKGTKELIKEQEEQLVALQRQVQELEQQKQMQHSRLALASKSSKLVQDKLLKSQDETNQLRLELSSKNRELLSLERGMIHHENEKKYQVHNDAVALSHAELGLRLTEMANRFRTV
jgi:chromosome segregation ATPase